MLFDKIPICSRLIFFKLKFNVVKKPQFVLNLKRNLEIWLPS